MEEQIIKWIAQRIKDEHRKHAKNIDNWEQIAARKIVATYNVTLRQPAVSGRSEQLHLCPVCDEKAGKSYLLSKLPTICQKCDHAWNMA